MFNQIKFVLIHTTHSGNIGAAARALKNMGFENLVLVAPLKFPDEEATARASGAKDILEKAKVCHYLEEAIEDCHLVFGLSARQRKIAWPILEPEVAAVKTLTCLQANNTNIYHEDNAHFAKKVAFVFGQEQFGLTNEQLEKCHYQIMIPANPDYSSLNIAQSIQIVTYDLRKAFLKQLDMRKEKDEAHFKIEASTKNRSKMNEMPVIKDKKQLTSQQMEGFYHHLEHILLKIGFFEPLQSPHLMTLLRRLFNKADLDQEEMNILRGILTAVEKCV